MKKKTDQKVLKKSNKKYKRTESDNLRKLITLEIIPEIPTFDFGKLKELRDPRIVNDGDVKNLQNDLEKILLDNYPKGISDGVLKYLCTVLIGLTICATLLYLINHFLQKEDSKEFVFFLQIVSVFSSFIITILCMAYCFKKDQKVKIGVEKKFAIVQSKWNRKFKNQHLKVKVSLKNLKFFYEEIQEEKKVSRFEQKLKQKEKMYKSQKKLPTIVEEEQNSRIEIFGDSEFKELDSHVSSIMVPDFEGNCKVKFMLTPRNQHQINSDVLGTGNENESTDKDN